MTELSFAKSFLAALDSRPVKLSSDNVVDPRTYPAQSAYILPRLPNAKRKRATPSADPSSQSAASSAAAAADEQSAASSGGLTVTLKPLKPTAATPAHSLTGQALTTSVYDIKAAYASAHALDPAKLRLLRSKKPVADSKALRDVLGEASADGDDPQQHAAVEFSVMVMPGAALEKKAPAAEDKTDVDSAAAAVPAPAPAPASVAQGPSGKEVLQSDEFWGDLKGFLVQRIRDEGEGERLVGVFRSAWESSAARP